MTFFFCLFQIIDDQIPTFNEWDDSTDGILSVHRVTNDDAENIEELAGEAPPSLAESLELVGRLQLWSTTQLSRTSSIGYSFTNKTD